MALTDSPGTRILPAMLLVAGTSIGGGMLALPVATGISGFFPSLFVMFFCWAAMTFTGLLLIEVSLWLEEGSHIISMSSKMLGPLGKGASWILYLFISYASIVAYTAGGGMYIVSVARDYFFLEFSRGFGCLIFFIVFGILVDLGTKIVGRVNTVLFFGMLGAYFLIVGVGAGEVKTAYLLHQNWSITFIGVPLILTSFSYQTMVPSLTPYLKRNAKYLRLSVIGGTSITFVIYIIWQLLVLGIVPPTGEASLAKALHEGAIATNFIKKATENTWVITVAEFFAFFALVTSFLGMSLGLFDFLSDGLKIPKVGSGRLKLGLLIALPTLYFAVYFERAFLVAMDISGGFGDTILNGIIPILMVWVGRYRHKLPNNVGFAGHRVFLTLALLFFLASLGIEILTHLGHLSSIYDIREVNYVD